MAVIGIESTAHTFGVGICEDGKIIANQKSMYQIKDKGMVPIKVAAHHSEKSSSVIKAALDEAGLNIEEIDAIGYSMGPGLGPCLAVGLRSAKRLALDNKIPLFPVNHAVAHIEVTKQRFGVADPLIVYVSGGNSQILGIEKSPFKHYHVYGETFDIGIGNMLDSFAREAGIVPSWGSEVAKVAAGGSYFEMPYTVKGMDFTFTGLLTFAVKSLALHPIKDVAYSLQETSFSMLCEASERAMLLTGKKNLIVCGGVAQSSRLKEMLEKMAKPHRRRVYVSPNELNADNGAMIAVVAESMFKSGQSFDIEKLDIKQRYRADSVEIRW
jgi:N6-L-threonylcarbamoyladenine synthase